MIRIYSANSKKVIKEYLNLMLEAELHHSRFTGSGFLLVPYRDYLFPIKAAIAKCDKQPIGIAMVFNGPILYGCNMGCFVKSDFRHQGIGSRLVNKIIPKEDIINCQFPENFPK